MLIDAESSGDTRRYRWDGHSPIAQTTKNRLPQSLTIHLLVSDDGIWNPLNESEALTLVSDLQTQTNLDHSTLIRSSQQLLEGLREKLESQAITCQIVTTSIPLLRGNCEPP